MNKMNSTKGFTLIEIIIVIAVLGVLGATAVSTFDAQKRKGYRTDGIRSVTVMAQRMENWRASTGAYTTNINDVGGNMFPPPPENPKYSLTLVADPAAETYTIRADAIGEQAKDYNCISFTIEHTGRKTAEKIDPDTSVVSANDKCWPK